MELITWINKGDLGKVKMKLLELDETGTMYITPQKNLHPNIHGIRKDFDMIKLLLAYQHVFSPLEIDHISEHPTFHGLDVAIHCNDVESRQKLKCIMDHYPNQQVEDTLLMHTIKMHGEGHPVVRVLEKKEGGMCGFCSDC